MITEEREHSEIELPLFVSRNLYPPRVENMARNRNFLHHYAWEECLCPQNWVDAFNLHLDGVTCLSVHVKKVLQDSGVIVPLAVSGCGVDHWLRIKPAKDYSAPGKTFKFLHVSSCFPRKGVDVLLDAYCDAFSKDDDVSLLIKTFDNPHNEVLSRLDDLRSSNADYPDVELLWDEMSDEYLRALYESCDALVAPSRAEGYGLPLVEAMLSGLPVITTGWGGQLDFCNDETAWLIDYDFAPADSHFQQSASVWVNSKTEDLRRLLETAYNSDPSIYKQKSDAARSLLLQTHTWRSVVGRLSASAFAWSGPQEVMNKPRIGWITSWNTKCGIAAYSEHLLQSFVGDVTILAPCNEELLTVDDRNVERVWEKHASDLAMDTLKE